MPNSPADPPRELVPLAGFQGWGPGTPGANGWTHRPNVPPTAPSLERDERQQLIQTARGAVLVMLTNEATPQEILAALEAAHIQVQRQALGATRRTA
jgi:hypothetical protein